MNTNYKTFFVILLLVAACRPVDLRTAAMSDTPAAKAEVQGRALLLETKKAMGYHKLEDTEVYEVNANFDWKMLWLLMPMNAFPGNNNKDLQFRFATNSFDGQVQYLEGRKEQTVLGLQSWESYQVRDGGTRTTGKPRHAWGLATYHYLLEAPMHLPDAEIVRYAGRKEMDGVLYEVVYVTWGTEAPNKDYDRFLVYIHPETKFIDALEVTINDFYLPMPQGMQHATARYERKKTTIGTWMPSEIKIQLKGPKKEESKVYSIALKAYGFDTFDRQRLYPLDDLPFYGTAKKTP